MNFKNIPTLTNVRCCFFLDRNEVILEFLLACWISTIFLHWPRSDVLSLFMEMRSFYNLSHHHAFQQYLIIDQRPMFFSCSSKWDHFKISLKMMNCKNLLSLTNIGCTLSLDQNGMILEFLWRWGISSIFHDWPTFDVLFFVRGNAVIFEFFWSSWISTIFPYLPTSDVLFLFMKMTWF